MSVRTRILMTVVAALVGAVPLAVHAGGLSAPGRTVTRAAVSPDGLIWD
ncbi:hypothetical protein OK074_1153 [Actinobacteria bacterium OK074]|nr:hypothetical protein OK074_1153 [Actinobacteria bacterium OK074]